MVVLDGWMDYKQVSSKGFNEFFKISNNLFQLAKQSYINVNINEHEDICKGSINIVREMEVRSKQTNM